MPTAWHGLWYQRGMNSLLEITIDHIQTKGRCQDVLPVQQYYLFNDRINRCTRCLLFIDRHPNLLQYRESECNDADELSSVTLCPNMIAPDAPLYTLYRNNSKSQLCPIQAPFLLTNLIKDGIKCPQSSSSSSYIGECANDHQFRLHLSPCSLFHQTVDFQLTCMATWIEGFNTYFVTRLHSKHHQYACFYFNTKQKDSASTFSLSMATDDSCRSLNSKQMTTVMTLSSVYSDEIKNIDTNHSCTFPNDIQQYQWYSLNHTVQMLINNENLELINLKTNNKYQRFHCLQMIDSTNYRIRAFTNCDVKDQCLRLIRRADNVLELILTNCYDNQTSQSLIFLTKTRSISSCSISIGHLLLESIIDHHHQHHSVILRNQPKQISVGCEQREKLMIHQIDTDSRSLTQTDTCLASWQSTDPSIIYILAQSIYSNASYCLTFQMSDSIIIRNNSHECSIIHSNTNLYSAKLLNPCSQSQRVLFNRYLVLLLLFYIHSKQ